MSVDKTGLEHCRIEEASVYFGAGGRSIGNSGLIRMSVRRRRKWGSSFGL